MHIDEVATELLSITVDGTEHSYDATVDTNHDGIDDTVHVDTDHGSYEYTDTDGDGVADALTQFDASGHATGQAIFDAGTGNWDSTTTADPVPLHGIDAAAADAGTPTIDSNGDGVSDTSVAHTPDGSTVLITDTDGDGSPDVVTEVDANGRFTTYEHSGDGSWHEGNHGGLAETPPTGPATHAVIDPQTGEWIRI